MKTFERLTMRVLLFALAMVGCDSGGLTQREEAREVGRAYCNLVARCSAGTDADTCATSYEEALCSQDGFDCDRPADDGFAECVDALDAHSCMPSTPPECTGILH